MVMNKADNLLVYKNKGRPTNAEVNHIKTHGNLRKKLYALKQKLNYKDGTDILLALSISSDEMMRVVHMFPEVIFMDVTANTNKQGRGLHLFVVKDADGSTHISNATVIPSEQRWVFKKIYSFFVLLFGEVTVSRFRLTLANDNPAEQGPFDSCIHTDKCYQKCIHQLCVFHGVVVKFQEQIFNLLSKKPLSRKNKNTKQNKRELTAVGRLYGT